MIEKEQNTLLEIDNIHTELNEESTGKWTGTYMQKPSGYNYCQNAERLRNKVFELYNNFKPDYMTENMLDAIAHTCSKEVSHVEYNYKLSIKRNAAKKRNTEFLDSIDKANKQIYLDLFSLFKQIEEVKKSND